MTHDLMMQERTHTFKSIYSLVYKTDKEPGWQFFTDKQTPQEMPDIVK